MYNDFDKFKESLLISKYFSIALHFLTNITIGTNNHCVISMEKTVHDTNNRFLNTMYFQIINNVVDKYYK